MLNIGCHLSITKGYFSMGRTAVEIGANTFQFFTRNPRGGSAKALDENDTALLEALMEKEHFAPLLAHAPYTLNLGSYNPQTRHFSMEMMADDLKRLEIIPCHLYNFHPGNNSKEGYAVAIQHVIDGLNKVLTENQRTIVLLETMSGKGNEVGGKFEQVKSIIDGIEFQDKIGVCIDTCHVFDAGYDIVNNLDGVLTEFDNIIGLERLKSIHLNDSMNHLGSHRDRHQKLGKGNIGWDAFRRIINHPSLRNLPFLLETPNEVSGYAEEIAELKKLYKE